MDGPLILARLFEVFMGFGKRTAHVRSHIFELKTGH